MSSSARGQNKPQVKPHGYIDHETEPEETYWGVIDCMNQKRQLEERTSTDPQPKRKRASKGRKVHNQTGRNSPPVTLHMGSTPHNRHEEIRACDPKDSLEMIPTAIQQKLRNINPAPVARENRTSSDTAKDGDQTAGAAEACRERVPPKKTRTPTSRARGARTRCVRKTAGPPPEKDVGDGRSSCEILHDDETQKGPVRVGSLDPSFQHRWPSSGQISPTEKEATNGQIRADDQHSSEVRNISDYPLLQRTSKLASALPPEQNPERALSFQPHAMSFAVGGHTVTVTHQVCPPEVSGLPFQQGEFRTRVNLGSLFPEFKTTDGDFVFLIDMPKSGAGEKNQDSG